MMGIPHDDTMYHCRDPDRREMVYYKNLTAKLHNLNVSVAQAIKDTWVYRMEHADFYLTWAEYPRDVQVLAQTIARSAKGIPGRI
jgi:hypothetical protein